MLDRIRFRLNDILDAVDQIDLLLADKSFADVIRERPTRAAFERFLEILSEASRHVPDGMKAETSGIAWRRISDIGNHLRHAYHRVDVEILWAVYSGGELARLREAVTGLLKSGR